MFIYILKNKHLNMIKRNVNNTRWSLIDGLVKHKLSKRYDFIDIENNHSRGGDKKILGYDPVCARLDIDLIDVIFLKDYKVDFVSSFRTSEKLFIRTERLIRYKNGDEKRQQVEVEKLNNNGWMIWNRVIGGRKWYNNLSFKWETDWIIETYKINNSLIIDVLKGGKDIVKEKRYDLISNNKIVSDEQTLSYIIGDTLDELLKKSELILRKPTSSLFKEYECGREEWNLVENKDPLRCIFKKGDKFLGLFYNQPEYYGGKKHHPGSSSVGKMEIKTYLKSNI